MHIEIWYDYIYTLCCIYLDPNFIWAKLTTSHVRRSIILITQRPMSSTLWPWFDIATSAAHAVGCSRLIPASQRTPTPCEALHDGALRSTREVPCKGARVQWSTSPSMAHQSSSAPVRVCRSGSVALFHRPCSLAPRIMAPKAAASSPPCAC
jgi:hypothetical protein